MEILRLIFYNLLLPVFLSFMYTSQAFVIPSTAPSFHPLPFETHHPTLTEPHKLSHEHYT